MKKWQLLKSDTVLSTPWFSLHKNNYKTTQGKIIHDYYVIERNDFVLIIAMDNDQKIILIRQYRAATNQFYIALPAGYLQHGEQPEVAAKRELFEETGYLATNCRLIGELHPLPGYVSSRAYIVFCEASAKNSEIIDQIEIEEVLKVDLRQAVQMIIRGEINEMQAVSAILLATNILESKN